MSSSTLGHQGEPISSLSGNLGLPRDAHTHPEQLTQTSTLYVGDVLECLALMADESVNCCVTSPPYWGLRDYGVSGQIGLESTPAEFVAKMVQVFREVRRVLTKDGTCWVNLGDSYASAWSCSRQSIIGQGACSKSKRINRGSGRWGGGNVSAPGLKEKDLCGIPWRVAFALQDDGWFLRQDIIWSKPNPMPESVRDRCTKAHEYIFLLAKSERYFYDQAAIKEPLAPSSEPRLGRANGGMCGAIKEIPGQPPNTNGRRGWKTPDGWDTTKGEGGHGSIHKNGREKGRKALPETQAKLGAVRDKNRESGIRTREDLNANWDASEDAGILTGANKRSVWTVATQPYPKAHFATFPEEIPRLCISAGCPIGGTVLDPFAGSGTTLAIAERLGRHSVGIELNEAYAELIRERVRAETPSLFAGGESQLPMTECENR